jgi:hypothetical protein
MKKILLSIIIACASVFVNAQTTITQWTFEGDVTIPSTGSGTASLIGGTTETFSTGWDGSTFTGRGWNTSTYPAQSTASGTAGVQYLVSTVGFEDISFTFDHRSSGTASRYAQFEYTTDGSSWNIIQNNNGGLSPHDAFYNFSIDLSSCTACDNNANFGIRIVSIFSPCEFVQNASSGNVAANTAYMRSNSEAQCTPHSTINTGDYSTAGTWRFDNVIFQGTALSPNISATPTTLSNFNQTIGSPSAEQSIDVSGSNLTNDILITPPTNYEISETSGSGFTSSITLTQSSGSVANTTIYIRLNSASNGAWNGNLDLTSTGATTVSIALNGTTSDPVVYPELYINEFMAGNTLTLADENDEFDDWFEIYNPTSSEVDLAGYYVTDDLATLNKHQIPTTSITAKIPANGWLLIWADNQPEQGDLHAAFALSKGGESIALVAPDGTTIIDSYTFGAQTDDISEGRQTDGNVTWVLFTSPTPGESNNQLSTLQNESKNVLRIYPNPSNGNKLYFTKKSNFEVYDVFGKIIAKEYNSKELNIVNFSTGIYLIKTSKGETLKFIRN